jgi:N-acetylmuramoyl-L-alanine amidase
MTLRRGIKPFQLTLIEYKSTKYLYLESLTSRKILIKNLKKTGFLTLFCLVFWLTLTGFHKDDPKGIKTIVIDAGHGGQDPGCNGITYKEKDVSLAVALRLGKLIEENCPDVKVIYTRKTDVFIPLEERAQIANRNKADLFISIHCNAAGKPVMIKDKKTGKMRPKTFTNKKGKKVVVETINPIPFGSETYVMGLKNEEGKMKVAQRENSAILLEDNYEKKYEGFDPESEESYIIMSNYTSAYVIQSAQLGLKIQAEYSKKSGRVDKGVHRQSIWVLWRTAMPSVLTEIGYLTNPLEEQFLGSEKGQKYLASSIFNGFRKFKDDVEGRKKEYNDEFENIEPLKNENLEAGNTGKPVKEEFTVEDDNENEPKPDSSKTVIKDGPKIPEIKQPDTSTISIATGTVTKKDGKEKEVEKPKEPEIKEKEAPKDVKEIVENYKNNSKKDSVITKAPVKEKEVEKPKEPEVKHEQKNQNGDVVVEFKVQFASSDKELNLKESKYSSVENGSYYKVGSFLKYTSGTFKTSAEAFKHQKKLAEAGFKDCFVVAFKNGQRIDVKEARALTEK